MSDSKSDGKHGIMSLRAFSARIGISRVTVSRVFTGKGCVAPETRKKILELAERYDFHPPVVRSSSRSGKTLSVGVLWPAFDASYFHDIMRGIQDELMKTRYLPIILAANTNNFTTCIERVLEHRVDGLIFYGGWNSANRRQIDKIIRLKIPLVILDEANTTIECDSVCTNDIQGGRLAAEYLLKNGHRHFIIVASGQSPMRQKGFIDCLREADVTFNEDQLISHKACETQEATLSRITGKISAIMKKYPKTTAMFASNDFIASDTIAAIRILNLRIPEDISIIGFCNLNFSNRLFPPLTTIKQNGYIEGYEAVRLLMSRLEGNKEPARKVEIATELISRATVASLVR